MEHERSRATERSSCALQAGAQFDEALEVCGMWRVWVERDSEIISDESFPNLVTTAGKNKMLSDCLKTPGAATWFVGLVTGPGSGNTYAAADTAASHAGWTENSTYSQATRQAFTPGTPAGGSVDNTASLASFSINGGATLAGCFLIDNSAKGGTTGTLFSVGNFTSGDRALLLGDVINVAYTSTLT